MFLTLIVTLLFASPLIFLGLAYQKKNNERVARMNTIKPDFSVDNIAINSVSGQIWLSDGLNERIVERNKVRTFTHHWKDDTRGRSFDHNFVFQINDLAAPRFEVPFTSGATAKVWKDRMDVFLSS